MTRSSGTSPARSVPRTTLLYKVVGKPVPRVDIPGKVTGAPSFVQDLRPPGSYPDACAATGDRSR